MDTNIECELRKDFDEMLEKINFDSYNPNSLDFLNALKIGLMIHVLKNEDKKTSINDTIYNEGYPDIADELFDAKKYLQKYIDTSDSVYKNMAFEELKHAEILIKKANSKLPNSEEKAKLKNYEDKIKEIKTHIE